LGMLERFPWLDFTDSQVHDAFNVTLNNAAFDPDVDVAGQIPAR